MSLPQDDPLVDQYFHEIKNSIGLPSETEMDLARRIHEGDEEALQELVRSNLRFVVTVAKKYQNSGMPLADLINAGNLGLITAAQRFDGTRGFKFISYAVWWVRQSILQSLAEQSRIVRLPSNRLGELTRINKVLSRLEQKLGHAPEASQIAQELKANPGDMEVSLGLAQSYVSLETPVNQDEPGRCFGDFMPDDSLPAVDEVLSQEEMKVEIRRAVHTLTEWEGRVICMYYGLDGNKPLALEDIGARFGRTRERIRQIKEKALQKLRHSSRSKALREYLGD